MALIRRNENQNASAQSRGWDPFQMMSELMRWDPFSEMGVAGRGGAYDYLPAFEVKETADHYVFSADVPGLRDEDIELTVTGNQLTIAGTRSETQRQEDDRVHLYERRYGTFSRTFALPDGVDTEGIEAKLERGVLDVSVPKRPEVKPRRISLKNLLRPSNKA